MFEHQRIRQIGKTILLFLFLGTLSLPVSAQTAEDKTGNWLMYFGNHRFNDRWSLHTEAQLRLFEVSQHFNQFLPRVGLNYHFKNGASITGGYAYIPTENFDKTNANSLSTEHRIWQQLILKNTLGRLNFEHRYRVEQRWVTRGNTTNYGDRLRYRLFVALPLNHKELVDKTFFIGLYDEIFINVSDAPFDQNRLYGALGYKLNAKLSFQAGYLRHRLGSMNLNRLQFAMFLNTSRG